MHAGYYVSVCFLIGSNSLFDLEGTRVLNGTRTVHILYVINEVLTYETFQQFCILGEPDQACNI